MSLIVSESLKERIDEETLVNNESKNEILVNDNNFIKIKNKKNGDVIIDLSLRQDQLAKLHKVDILSVKMLNNVYEKIRVKQIIKDWDKYNCRLICKEKKIEND